MPLGSVYLDCPIPIYRLGGLWMAPAGVDYGLLFYFGFQPSALSPWIYVLQPEPTHPHTCTENMFIKDIKILEIRAGSDRLASWEPHHLIHVLPLNGIVLERKTKLSKKKKISLKKVQYILTKRRVRLRASSPLSVLTYHTLYVLLITTQKVVQIVGWNQLDMTGFGERPFQYDAGGVDNGFQVSGWVAQDGAAELPSCPCRVD